jgi:phosphoribosylglycinamide formyltransferase 1
MNVGVLASGTGTNLQALIDAGARGDLGRAHLAGVGVNVAGCAALDRARAAGIATFVIDHRQFGSRDAFDEALLAELVTREIDLVVLAGFMRILTPRFLEAFPNRVINIHPSLLPAFPGMNAQAQALHYGAKMTGCTVHFVEPSVDTGPIIAQRSVPVLDDDDLERLRRRIVIEEHKLLPEVVRAISEERVRIEGRRVWLTASGS